MLILAVRPGARRLFSVALVAAVAGGSCALSQGASGSGAPGSETPSATLATPAPSGSGTAEASPAGPVFVVLPVSPLAEPPSSVPVTCGGEALNGHIYLRADGREIFGEWGGSRLRLQWPPGFRAVFDPDFTAVLDARGDVFARPGDELNTPPGQDLFRGLNTCYSPGGIDFW